MIKNIRSFIAIQLPQEIIETIKKLQEHLRNYGLNIRWVPPANIHLTLKFLGNISEEDIALITNTLKTAADTTESFHLRGQGIGIFPAIKRPRLIWLGVSGAVETLAKVQQCVEKGLEQVGFPREGRPFRAHLTMGRIKGRLDKRILSEAIEHFGDFESEFFQAKSITLFRSDLHRNGAVYTKLAEAPFVLKLRQEGKE